MIIRQAIESDISPMLDIYAYYVEHTAVTFEYEVPSVEEFKKRFSLVTAKYPWVVAEEDGRVVGYAYASTFKDRDAYQWAVETSIYVWHEARRGGVGVRLHERLEEMLRAQGILNMNACIAYLEKPDAYLNLDSVHFHERMGYQMVAHFHKCGRKNDRWYDMVWMEKHIGPHN